MPKIFISYRRADSRPYAGRLYDRLEAAFGAENVFMDVNNDNIPLGRDFRGVLRESVARCDVLLAVIGKQWLTIADENGARRLDNPNDFVRIEIESALQRDTCLVIPLTVEGAYMPAGKDLPEALRELAFKNGTALRDDPDFHPDVNKIIRALENMNSGSKSALSKPGQPAKQAPQPPPPSPMTFNVYEAIDRYHAAFDAQEWENARTVLNEIRTSAVKIPRAFNIDANEKDIGAEIEAEEQKKQEIEEAEEREREYNILRRMAKASTPNAARIWEALQAFWESYPDDDPDDLARFKLILAQEYFDHAMQRPDNDPDGKIADYTEAIRLNPQFAEAYFQRGYIYDYKKEDYKRSFSDYSDTIRLNPQHAGAYAERAGNYILAGNYVQAIADCTEAIRINPQYTNAYNSRGFSYFQKEDYKRAIADYEAVLRIEPDHSYARQSLQNSRDELKRQKK